ncbi:MAG: TIM barrel protein [Bryobacteraceae bacterium]
MVRRQFLAGVGGLAVAQAPQVPPPKAKITSSVMLWTLKGSLEEKLEAAARSGVQSVELVAEYAEWSDADFERYRKLCRGFRLVTDSIAACPNWARRPVSMLDPAEREGFLADLRNAIQVARKLEVPQIILMSGNTIAGRTREEQRASLLEGLKRAADLAAAASLDVILEPLNSLVNHKGYFLDSCVEGLRLVKEADNPHLKLLFDIYHEQVQAGNVIRTLTEAAPHVAVFHVADNPGRHEPGTGELNWPNIYKAIRKTGFAGYVCMEFLPQGEQVAALTKALNEFRAA